MEPRQEAYVKKYKIWHYLPGEVGACPYKEAEDGKPLCGWTGEEEETSYDIPYSLDLHIGMCGCVKYNNSVSPCGPFGGLCGILTYKAYHPDYCENTERYAAMRAHNRFKKWFSKLDYGTVPEPSEWVVDPELAKELLEAEEQATVDRIVKEALEQKRVIIHDLEYWKTLLTQRGMNTDSIQAYMDVLEENEQSLNYRRPELSLFEVAGGGWFGVDPPKGVKPYIPTFPDPDKCSTEELKISNIQLENCLRTWYM